VRLVRFADDFLLLCKGDLAARDARDEMAALLAAEGLELHVEKSRIVTFSQGVRFLGHVFVNGMIWKEIEADETPPEAAVIDAPREEAPEPPVEAPLRGAYAPRQRVVYVVTPGHRLTADGETFVVRAPDGAEEGRIAHGRVDRFEVTGAADIDAAALDLAGATDTVIARVDGFGRTLGLWSPMTDDRASRQLAQARHVLDPALRMALARQIVEGRILSQRGLLRRLTRGKPNAGVAAAAPKLKRMARYALLNPKYRTPQDLMGQEGEAGALYWPLLAERVGDAAIFGGHRRRRTGHDPFNIVVDVLSSLLSRDLSVAVRRAGLHPGFGVLHQADDGAEALVYDLMEEFRAPVVEACAVALFGRRALTLASFTAWGRQHRLTQDGYAAVLRGYEKWVSQPVVGQRSGREMWWRGVFEEQVAAYAGHVEGRAAYVPYRVDY